MIDMVKELNKLINDGEPRKKDVSCHHIGVIKTDVPRPVENFLDAYKTVQEQTARQCLVVAEQLEAAAAELRNKAAILNHQAVQIPDDIRHSTTFEREARSLAETWKFVNPPRDG